MIVPIEKIYFVILLFYIYLFVRDIHLLFLDFKEDNEKDEKEQEKKNGESSEGGKNVKDVVVAEPFEKKYLDKFKKCRSTEYQLTEEQKKEYKKIVSTKVSDWITVQTDEILSYNLMLQLVRPLVSLEVSLDEKVKYYLSYFKPKNCSCPVVVLQDNEKLYEHHIELIKKFNLFFEELLSGGKQWHLESVTNEILKNEETALFESDVFQRNGFKCLDELTEGTENNDENFMMDLKDVISDYVYDMAFFEYLPTLLSKKEEEKCPIQEFQDEAIRRVKLAPLMNNYVVEYTPVGNVTMRYNVEKGSFEYFSDRSVPYRYLEPVGRKYAITYGITPLFVDEEEEIQKAMDVNEKKKVLKVIEDAKKIAAANADSEKKKLGGVSNVNAQFKSYNKKDGGGIKGTATMVPKNRNDVGLSGIIQRSHLVDVSSGRGGGEEGKGKESKVLVQNANRYTWEGRYSCFEALKKVPIKKVSKIANLSYRDFKKKK